jgi:hypothetical protein
MQQGRHEPMALNERARLSAPCAAPPPADDGVELALARRLREVAPILGQSLVLALGVLVLHAAGTRQREARKQSVAVHIHVSVSGRSTLGLGVQGVGVHSWQKQAVQIQAH